MLAAQLCPTLCHPTDCSPPGSSVHGILKNSKNTEVGSHSLLWGIFPAQGLNPCLLHCRQILYCLSHQGSPSPEIIHVNNSMISTQQTLDILIVLYPNSTACPPFIKFCAQHLICINFSVSSQYASLLSISVSLC